MTLAWWKQTPTRHCPLRWLRSRMARETASSLSGSRPQNEQKRRGPRLREIA
jgi:hypothetical protein